MDLINVCKRLEKKENFKHGLPQTEEEIADLEKRLEVKFPESYKKLLRKYGYISFFGTVIYGPSKDSFYNLLVRNIEARDIKLPREFKPLPNDAFIFMEYGGGGYYMLFSDNSPRKGQVGLFLDETYYEEAQTWENLDSFFEDYFRS